MTADADSAAVLMAEADETWRRAYDAVDAACAALAAVPGAGYQHGRLDARRGRERVEGVAEDNLGGRYRKGSRYLASGTMSRLDALGFGTARSSSTECVRPSNYPGTSASLALGHDRGGDYNGS